MFEIANICIFADLAEPVYLQYGSSGRVYIEHNGQNGTVCDDSFEDEECDIVCRQLGYE